MQPENAELPMLVTEFTDFPMVTLVRPEQSVNALLPMLITELGMVTLDRLEHSENAPSAIPRVPAFKVMPMFDGIVPL